MFQVIDPGHELRPLVEATIRSAYQREHGARLASLPSLLVATTDETGVIGAASLCFAEDGFFSESYLDQPIEKLVARHTGTYPDRAGLVEVGSLAAGRPGEIRSLVSGLIDFLDDRGTRWAFFTATARLRTFLRRAGIPLIELAAADPARINNASAWGGYYRQDPRVMLVGGHMLAPGLRPGARLERTCRHA